MRKLKRIHRSCRESDRKREGQLLFFIIAVSYNARYAKLREAKNTHFPDFLRSRPGWLIFGLGLTVLHILHFLSYFIVFFVSRLQIVSALCACFITFHVTAVVVHLLLCRHYFACFYQNVSMDVPAWIARIVNYKDPWQHPVESDHVMGLCVFSGTFLNQIM